MIPNLLIEVDHCRNFVQAGASLEISILVDVEQEKSNCIDLTAFLVVMLNAGLWVEHPVLLSLLT